MYFFSGPPNFDRGSKPTSLLSPSLNMKTFGGLRSVIVPSRLLSSFINIAHRNTSSNIETCGILAGKLVRLSKVEILTMFGNLLIFWGKCTNF